MVFEPAYELDLLLIAPRNHPLARRRRLVPDDLVRYPLVNSPSSIPDPAINAALHKLGVYRNPTRRVEAIYTAAIRRYVELGFGIGLVFGVPSPNSSLCERSVSRLFGPVRFSLVYRRGVVPAETLQCFVDTIQEFLGRRPGSTRSK